MERGEFDFGFEETEEAVTLTPMAVPRSRPVSFIFNSFDNDRDGFSALELPFFKGATILLKGAALRLLLRDIVREFLGEDDPLV